MPPIPPIPNIKATNDNDENKNEVNLTEVPLATQMDVGNEDEDSGGDDGLGHYDQNGQIVYQQLNLDEDVAGVDDEGFDDFQQFAESRSTNQPKQQQVIFKT